MPKYQLRLRRKTDATKKPVIKLRYKKQPIKAAVNKLARRQVQISRNLYQWKSYRILNTNQTLNMIGDLSTTAPNGCRALAWELSDIPFHDPHSGVGNELAVSSSRMTTRPYIDRIVARLSVKCTHNQLAQVRFISFINDGWMESLNLQYTGTVAPIISDATNLFKDWLTLADTNLAGTGCDSRKVSLAVVNKALFKTNKRNLLLDKTFTFRPFQGEVHYQGQAMVSGTGPADVDTANGTQVGSKYLRDFKFTLPIKKRWYYERRKDVDGEVYDVKSGKIFFLAIFSSGANTYTANSGDATVDARFATVFKENT